MYRMLPDGFKSGGGVGSSIIAVLYDLPRAISILLSFLTGFFIQKFEQNVKSSRLLLVSSYYIVFAVASSLRYEPLQLIYDLLILLIVYTIIDHFTSKALIKKTQNEQH